ncbi:MAG: peptide deformylase [Oscillospiraceae bacterium]|jgi:peptide deformylase|nr:peptide deformylase [Oscillospiraceae bacterium]
MALRQIVKIGDPALRKHARPVEKFGQRLHTLLDDMAQTMYDANGCGLAAPQVGILQRAVVIDMGGEDDHLVELVNPQIVSAEGEEESTEGCLSVPDRRGYVVRPVRVTVRAQNRCGMPIELTGEGMFARCICHELDHLDGRLYVDIMTREAEKGEEDAGEDA